jgi:hypothetical protein
VYEAANHDLDDKFDFSTGPGLILHKNDTGISIASVSITIVAIIIITFG